MIGYKNSPDGKKTGSDAAIRGRWIITRATPHLFLAARQLLYTLHVGDVALKLDKMLAEGTVWRRHTLVATTLASLLR